jgi:dephospho-CoA kinase
MHEIASKRPDAIVVVEAALMLEAAGRLETGLRSRYDKIVVVTCRPEQKVERYAVRMGISEAAARAEVERRSRAQMPDPEKAALADYVIDNSGPPEVTRAKVGKIFSELKALNR